MWRHSWATSSGPNQGVSDISLVSATHKILPELSYKREIVLGVRTCFENLSVAIWVGRSPIINPHYFVERAQCYFTEERSATSGPADVERKNAVFSTVSEPVVLLLFCTYLFDVLEVNWGVLERRLRTIKLLLELEAVTYLTKR